MNSTPPPFAEPLRESKTVLAQLLRFALVGVGLNAVLYDGYLSLVDRGLTPTLAMTATYFIGTALGFMLHRQWSFGSRGVVHREWGAYVSVGFAGYVLNLAVLGLCVHLLGWPHAWVQGVMVFVVAGVTFSLNKSWVFRASRH